MHPNNPQLQNNCLAHLKWEKTRPDVSDAEIDKFRHASQTRASGVYYLCELSIRFLF